MPSRNDLSAIKLAHKGALQKMTLNNPGQPANTGGRSAKPTSEKQSVVIGLKFTPSQAELIKEKAGLIPVATYMKDILFNQTDILK